LHLYSRQSVGIWSIPYFRALIFFPSFKEDRSLRLTLFLLPYFRFSLPPDFLFNDRAPTRLMPLEQAILSTCPALSGVDPCLALTQWQQVSPPRLAFFSPQAIPFFQKKSLLLLSSGFFLPLGPSNPPCTAFRHVFRSSIGLSPSVICPLPSLDAT